MIKQSKIPASIIIVLTFLLAFYGKIIVSEFFSFSISSEYLNVAYGYSWWIIPIVLVTGVLFGFNGILKTLGLEKGFLRGFVFALIAVSPMLISSAIIGRVAESFNLITLLHSTLFAGFAEELLFRGFLFGILFRKLCWGFIPASILGALFFGIGHVYQGSALLETIGVFFITAFGAVWFAWLYIEWNNNLWVPIFLHILMNLSWMLFEVSSTALGGWYANLFRVMTIALTIIITIRFNKINGLYIKMQNLIVHKSNL